MNPEFQVQVAGLSGTSWTTVWQGAEARAGEVFLRDLPLYFVGHFRLLGPGGVVVGQGRADRQARQVEQEGLALAGNLPAR